MFTQGLIKKRVFSFQLNKKSESKSGGELVIGACPFDSVLWVPLTKPTYWQFRMGAVSFDGINIKPPLCPNGCEAIADTGAALM